MIIYYAMRHGISLTQLSVLLVCVLTVFSACRGKLPEQPNILVIMTDYQAGEDIPDETAVLRMPHLQKLSRDGLIFRNHICTAPVCMPSRYTFISGRYPHYTGMLDNGGSWLPEGTPVLMEELSALGYHTAGIGKMHFSPWDRMAGFDVRITADRKGNWAGDTTRHDDYWRYLKRAGHSRNDYLSLQDSGEVFGLYDWPLDDSLHIDYFVGVNAANYIQEIEQDKPWFVWVSFNGPHNPWDPPAKYSEYYLNKELPCPRLKEAELEEHPIDITRTRYNYTRKVVDKIDQHPEKRLEYIHRIRAGHYGGLTYIDEQVGKILSSLKKTKQLDNTIIIWTSDHGSHLGDHNLIHKATHYERSARVPMVVWWGKHVKPGERSGFSSHVDLMPTFIDLAGGEASVELEGQSLREMLTGASQGSDHAFVEIYGNYSVITDEYIYGVFPGSKEQVLIDRITDPQEFTNLIKEPLYKRKADSLRDILYHFHPAIEDEYERTDSLPDLPVWATFSKGNTYRGGQVPYLGGTSFLMHVEFDYHHGYEGPIFVFHEGRTHGISLYVKESSLYSGFRTYSEDQVEVISDKLIDGVNSLSLNLNMEGVLEVIMNETDVARFKTSWPMPVQEGNKYFLTGEWSIGKTAHAWMGCIGAYESSSSYPGTIDQITIRTNLYQNR